MGLLSSKKLVFKHLLCVIDVFTKYALVKSLKDKKTKTVLHSFVDLIKESNRKSSKSRLDRERGIYNSPMQNLLHCNGLLIYSPHNKGWDAYKNIKK